jgi:hypothetical protein
MGTIHGSCSISSSVFPRPSAHVLWFVANCYSINSHQLQITVALDVMYFTLHQNRIVPVLQPSQPSPLRLHPAYGKFRASSGERLVAAKIIQRAKVSAIRYYKAAQLKIASVHSALMRYIIFVTIYVF